MINDDSPAYLLHKLVFDLDRAADRLLVAHLGITYKRLLFLALLHQHGTITQHELALVLGYSDPAVSTMLLALNKAGYLTSTASPAHGRKHLVTLTPAGRQIVRKSRRLLDARFEALFDAAGVDLPHYTELTAQLCRALAANPSKDKP